MLTVLIKYVESKRECIIPARSIEFSRAKEDAGLRINLPNEADGSTYLAMTAKGDSDFRDVFVMNDQGQTVARYSL